MANIVVTPGIYMVPNDAIFIKNDLYLASYQGIFKSEDLGIKWKKQNDMSRPITVIIVLSKEMLYMQEQRLVVHVSYDKGITWHVLNGGMEDIWTGPLVLNNTRAFSGTYGESVWRNSLDKLNERPTITALYNR